VEGLEQFWLGISVIIKLENGISISHGMWDYWLMLDLSF